MPDGSCLSIAETLVRRPPRDLAQVKHAGVWCEVSAERLRELVVVEGMSGTETARTLHREFPGRGFTRNAVIGKSDRLCLPTNRKPSITAPARTRTRKPRVVVAAKVAAAPPLRLPPVNERAARARSLPDDAAPVSILAVRRDQCRWMCAEIGPEALCCGAPIMVGRPYCGFHAPLAVAPRSTSHSKN